MKCFPEETDLSPQRGSSQDIHALLKKATEKLDFLDQEQKGSNTGGWSSQPPPPPPPLDAATKGDEGKGRDAGYLLQAGKLPETAGRKRKLIACDKGQAWSKTAVRQSKAKAPKDGSTGV